MTLDPRTRIVQAGYDALGGRYGAWSEAVVGDQWPRFLDALAQRLPDGARVLDLGCGDGAKLSRIARRFDVTGVDLSEAQLRLARAAAPAGTFVHADFTQLDFPRESFDAVTALYSILHVPRDEQPALLARIERWL